MAKLEILGTLIDTDVRKVRWFQCLQEPDVP